MPRNKIIEAKDLVKWYGREVLALDHISFDVKEGDFYVIIGPSGCGKSTLIKIIAGILDYNSGELYIKGKDVKNVPAYKRDISMMLESYACWPHMNVFNNVAFGLRMLGKPRSQIKEKVMEALKLVGLEGLEKRYPHEISGGQKQRTALARSLVIEPTILLLDEPFTRLDYRLQRKLMEDFKIIHEKLGTTFVLTTHYQEHGLSLAEEMMVMNTGVIEQIGAAEEVYNRPRTVFAARFVGDITLLPGEVTSMRGDKYFVKTDIGDFKAKAYDKGLVDKKLAYGIRPEYITVSSKPSKHENRVTASLSEYYYFGENVEFIFNIKPDTIMKASVPQSKVKEIKVGKKYTLGWNTSDAVLLEKPSVIEGLDIEAVIYGK
jgi:ABC-type Fe3+/spermidine/putrescine transport system ATPase subunit